MLSGTVVKSFEEDERGFFTEIMRKDWDIFEDDNSSDYLSST